MAKTKALLERVMKRLPGATNGASREYGTAGGNPRFLAKAKGVEIVDANGKRFLDFSTSDGPMLLGHNHPEVLAVMETDAAEGDAPQLTELICQLVPSIENVCLVASGAESVRGAVRAARAFTGRTKLIHFEGCSHGDVILPGDNVLTAYYNDLDSVSELFEQNRGEIGAVLVEPVATQMGVVVPNPQFLQGLRSLCDANCALLIFDESVTGFRLGLDGAQGYYRVRPDLTIFGDNLGAGRTIGAYGGRKDVMEQIEPSQASLHDADPLAVSIGLAKLRLLKKRQEVYAYLNDLGEYYRKSMKEIIRTHRMGFTVSGVGALSCLFFTPQMVVDLRTAKTSDMALYDVYCHEMRERGLWLEPTQFGGISFSALHTRAHIDRLMESTDEIFRKWKKRAKKGAIPEFQ